VSLSPVLTTLPQPRAEPQPRSGHGRALGRAAPAPAARFLPPSPLREQAPLLTVAGGNKLPSPCQVSHPSSPVCPPKATPGSPRRGEGTPPALSGPILQPGGHHGSLRRSCVSVGQNTVGTGRSSDLSPACAGSQPRALTHSVPRAHSASFITRDAFAPSSFAWKTGCERARRPLALPDTGQLGARRDAPVPVAAGSRACPEPGPGWHRGCPPCCAGAAGGS